MPDGMGVKVAVVGGGSTYTPELVEGFVTRGDRLPVDELVLLDIDRERLDVVGALAERMMRRAGWAGRLTLTDDRVEAIDGADFVIVQLRVGGNQARYRDETIPPLFGCIGQETTGPGGFAKALRTVPVVLELAELTAERGAPGAWFVDFTNPTGLVTQALLDQGHRAIGLCNVAIGFQREFASMFEVDPSSVQLDHVGLNHLTWERKVLVDGEDRLPALLEALEDPDSPVQAYRRELEAETHLDLVQALRRDPQLLPPLLLRRRSRARGPAGGGDPARRGGHEDRGGPAGAVSRPDARHETEAPGGTRRRVLQRRRRGAGRLAPCGHGRRAGREPAQRRRDREPARRCRGGDLGHDRSRGRPSDRHRRRSRRPCTAWWRTRRPTNCSRSTRRSPAAGSRRCRR